MKLGQTVNILASASDADSDTVSYVWSRKTSETVPALPQNTKLDRPRLKFTPGTIGVYTMTVTASDGNGNSDTDKVVITVNKAATVSVRSLTVQEGSSNSYTIKLNSQPSDDVTLNVSVPASDLSVSGTPLTFTRINYGTAQQITVTAGTDPDTDTDPDVALTHTVSGGGYDNATIGSVVVSIVDTTPTSTTTTTTTTTSPPTTTSTTTTTTTTSTTSTVPVNAPPQISSLSDVSLKLGQSVDITASATDTDGDTLSFLWARKATETTPTIPQSVTLNDARLNFTPTEVGTYTMTVTVSDTKGGSDTATVVIIVSKAATLSVAELTVEEGSTGSYTIKLNSQPSGNVTVDVSGQSGDVSVSGVPLTFTTGNYSIPQTVTVNAASDADTDTDPDVVLSHTASGGGYDRASVDSVTVRVTDNTPAGYSSYTTYESCYNAGGWKRSKSGSDGRVFQINPATDFGYMDGNMLYEVCVAPPGDGHGKTPTTTTTTTTVAITTTTTTSTTTSTTTTTTVALEVINTTTTTTPGSFGTGTNEPVTKPNIPANVTVVPGDTEALVSWSSGGNGENGLCATTNFYAVLYEQPNHQYTLETPTTEATSWLADGLKASTTYEVHVYAWGQSCFEYADTHAVAQFTTNASDTESDPTAPANNPKKTPHSVREFTATPSEGSVTLTWKAAEPGDLSTRCDLRINPASGSPNVQYSYDIKAKNEDDYFVEQDLVSGNTGETPITVTVNGLASGTIYEAKIAAYSTECDEWNRYEYAEWTQP